MAHAPVQLVAIDLDGTLLNSSKCVCAKAAEAIAESAAKGVRVVIASARPPRSVRKIYQSLGLNTWQINYNGALIWDEPGQRAVSHFPLDPRLVLGIIDEARALYDQVIVTCEILDRWFTDRFEQAYTTETGRLFGPDVVAPHNEFCNQPITKLMLLGEPRIISHLEAVLASRQEIAMVRGEPDLIQIMDRQVSKAAALRKVAEEYGVPMEQVLAIGDAANDISMLRAAGVGVAMDNAPAAVKAAADWVAPSNDDHGVHAAFARYGLI